MLRIASKPQRTAPGFSGRSPAQCLVRPWALILGGRLYIMLIHLFPCTVRPTLYRISKLFRETQAICNCRLTARAVIWFTSCFPNLSVFLLTALGGLPENPGTNFLNESWWPNAWPCDATVTPT